VLLAIACLSVSAIPICLASAQAFALNSEHVELAR